MLTDGPQPETGNKPALLRNRLDYNVRHFFLPDSTRPIQGAFSLAARNDMDTPPYRGVIDEMFKSRPSLQVSHAHKLVERAFQHDLRHNDLMFPVGYDNPARWSEAFREITPDTERWSELRHNLLNNSVQSSIAERYKSIKLLAYLLRDRFTEPPSILDVGSSGLHGSLKLAYNRSGPQPFVPFGDIEVVERIEGSESLHVNERHTKVANWILDHTVEIGPITGIDITDIDDGATREWVRSCSFYFDELLDPQKAAEYDTLDSLDLSHNNVQFIRDDFLHINLNEFRRESQVKQYDIIVFSTIFYQLSKTEQFKMLVNASQLLSENGVIAVQDAPDGNFEKKYNYYTYITDNNSKMEPLLQWQNGRCQKVILAQGRFAIKGALHDFAGALDSQIT